MEISFLVIGSPGGHSSNVDSHLELSGGVEHNVHLGNSHHNHNTDLNVQFGDKKRKSLATDISSLKF